MFGWGFCVFFRIIACVCLLLLVSVRAGMFVYRCTFLYMLVGVHVDVYVDAYVRVYSSVLEFPSRPRGFLWVPGFTWHRGAWFPPHCWPNSSILDVWHSLRHYLSICLVTWHRRCGAPLASKTPFFSFKRLVKSVNKSSQGNATEQRSPEGRRCDLFAVWED